MPNQTPPVPLQEMERIIELSKLDLDYTALSEDFKDLAFLAAKVAGTEISLINLIDSYTQWTIARHGIAVEQMDRKESVCQYTIASDDGFEVQDLYHDQRVKDNYITKHNIPLQYYYGIPLKFKDGINLGALCVLNSKAKPLNTEQKALLKIVADEIVTRLKAYQTIADLKHHVDEAVTAKHRAAHDIRGPLNGIIGLLNLIDYQGEDNNLEEILQLVGMMQKSSRSLLELADEILNEAKKEQQAKDALFNLRVFKQKIHQLYDPQALNKGLHFEVNVNPAMQEQPFAKDKLLQITGNLISNAIKFTSSGGVITITLDILSQEKKRNLHISVADSGIGLTAETQAEITDHQATSTSGTAGETGYGLGLAVVMQLVKSLSGTVNVNSTLGVGTTFVVSIPLDSTAFVEESMT
jgi:signal transduction histidine kinase